MQQCPDEKDFMIEGVQWSSGVQKEFSGYTEFHKS